MASGIFIFDYDQKMIKIMPYSSTFGRMGIDGVGPGVEEDAELKWGHLKFLAFTPHPLKIYIRICS